MDVKKYNYKPSEVHNFLKTLFSKFEIENFMIIHLSKEYQVKSSHIIKVGTLNNSLTHVSECFKLALQSDTKNVAFSHIIPTGKPEPSVKDKETAKRLKQGGEILGIEVIDYLIITDKGYFSFQDKNLL